MAAQLLIDTDVLIDYLRDYLYDVFRSAKTSANRERLLKARENITQNRNLVTITSDELRGREILGEWRSDTR